MTAPKAGPSWASNGEFLIDGLGVDGRDCTTNEAGWAEPGTMSALWGFKPGSPSTRRFSLATNTALPLNSVPQQSELKRLSSQDGTLAGPHRARSQASTEPHEGSTTAVPAPLAGVRPPPASAMRCARYSSAPSTARSLPIRSGESALAQSQCAACRTQHSNKPDVEATACAHCLNGSAEGRAAFTRGLQRIWQRPDKQANGALGLDAIDEAAEVPSLAGTSITVIDIIQGRTCRPISLSKFPWSTALTPG